MMPGQKVSDKMIWHNTQIICNEGRYGLTMKVTKNIQKNSGNNIFLWKKRRENSILEVMSNFINMIYNYKKIFVLR